MARAIVYKMKDNDCEVAGVIINNEPNSATDTQIYTIDVLFSSKYCDETTENIKNIHRILKRSNRYMAIGNSKYPVCFYYPDGLFAVSKNDKNNIKRYCEPYWTKCIFMGFRADMANKKILQIYE